jgi:hypothetical protein
MKYNIPGKCILLCPTDYNKEYEEESVILFTFKELLVLLKNSKNPDTEGIRKELIKFIEEEYEGTFTNLNKHLAILNHSKELRTIQSHILLLRKAMLEEYKSKSGLWKKDSFAYYFGVGLKNKRLSDKNNLSWLSYDFYYEDEVKSPLKIEFPKKFINKKIFGAPSYRNKNKYQTDLINEFTIDKSCISFFDHTKCGNNLPKAVNDFAEYYCQESKKQYLKKYNKLLHSGIKFIEKIDIEVSDKYQTIFYHNLKEERIIIRLKIKKRIDGIYSINLVFEPTSDIIENILRIETCEKDTPISKPLTIILNKNEVFRLKYNLTPLVNLMSQKIENLYK